jgi:hypothetical protein
MTMILFFHTAFNYQTRLENVQILYNKSVDNFNNYSTCIIRYRFVNLQYLGVKFILSNSTSCR